MNRLTTLTYLLAIATLAATTLGCKDRPAAENKGIFGKKDTIAKFDPEAENQVSDGKIKPANPLNPLGALKSYGPAVEQISKLHIEKALQFFYASEGRYPRDFEEFMERVVKPNNIKLAKLPGGRKYQYDVKNHKLIVVENTTPKE